jgi:hypothetical protein
MKKLLFAVVIFVFHSSLAIAVPSPALPNPLQDWNFGNEPLIKGGAKEITLTTIRNGSPSKSKYIIKIDPNGRYAESKLVTEGSDKTYIKTFKRDGDGKITKLVEKRIEGGVEVVYSIRTPRYEDGILKEIIAEQHLTKSALQPAGKAVVKGANKNKIYAELIDKNGKIDTSIEFEIGKSGRAKLMRVTRKGKTQVANIRRNSNGLIESVVIDGNEIVCSYEMDNNGNWTKATISRSLKSKDSTEKKSVSQVVRTIVY